MIHVMKIFNSQTGMLETFTPIREGKVSMYVCGPTVYNYIHIGNARPVVFFDTVARFLATSGYEVHFVSNITDVDDKIIAKAQEEQVEETVITKRYTDAFLADSEKVNVSATVQRMFATEYIQEMIDMIATLIDKGIAYEQNGNVYFNVAKIKEYGALSHQDIEQLVVGARIEENIEKENPIDFTLWKATDTGVRWESPWSLGRPGWHTECASMIQTAFGGPIDIHGGGMDLKFPHHENELAHARGCGWDGLANYWMHNGFVEMNNEKMSKSLGNFTLLRDVVDAFGGNATRYWLLSVHYRQPISFSEETMKEAREIVERMEQSYQDASTLLQLHDYQVDLPITSEVVTKHQNDFFEAMDNDMNTANAITVLQEVFKQLNIHVRQGEKSFGVTSQYLKLIELIVDVLGFSFEIVVVTDDLKKVYNDWQTARSNKDFATADELRNTLQEKNIRVR